LHLNHYIHAVAFHDNMARPVVPECQTIPDKTNKPALTVLQAGCPSCRPTNSVKALKSNTDFLFN